MESIKYNELTLSHSISTSNKSAINKVTYLKDGRIAACSNDKTIGIYNIKTYTCEIILIAHDSLIFDIIQLDNSKLVSCCARGSKEIKVWSLSQTTLTCDKTILSGYTYDIYSLVKLSKNRFATASFDLIKIWSSNEPYDLVKTITVDPVNSMLQLREKEILACCGGNSGKVQFINLETYNVESEISGVKCLVLKGIAQIDENKLMISGLNEIFIVNMKSKTIELNLHVEGEEQYEYCFETFLAFSKEKVMISKIANVKGKGYICVFDTKSNAIEKSIESSMITSFEKIDEHTFVTCSRNKTIEIWNY